MKNLLRAFAASLLVVSLANAQGPGRGGRGGATPTPQPEGAAPANTADRFPAPPAVDTTSKTKHEITVNGKKIPYSSTAGTLVLKKEDGKPWASIFYVAYTREIGRAHV